MENINARRRFLQTVIAGSLVSMLPGRQAAAREDAASRKKSADRLKLGIASYSLRKLPLTEAMQLTKRVGLEYVCLKAAHLPLDSDAAVIRKVAKSVRQTGLILYGAGVIGMKTPEEIDRAFDYAKAAGIKTIVGVPMPELLDMVDRKVKEYDIQVAIHNHGPTDKVYPVPATALEKIKGLDKRIGVCMDIGHTQRAGVDPSQAARQAGSRLLDVHMKDVTAATAEGRSVEVGRGVIDIPGFLKTLLAMNYDGVVSFEYEKDARNPAPGLAESVGYVRGVLSVI